MPGVGHTQIINGREYELYSPAWYAAREDDERRKATLAGQTQGLQQGTAARTGYETEHPGYSYPAPGAATVGATQPASLSSLTRTMNTWQPPDVASEDARRQTTADAAQRDQVAEQRRRMQEASDTAQRLEAQQRADAEAQRQRAAAAVTAGNDRQAQEQAARWKTQEDQQQAESMVRLNALLAEQAMGARGQQDRDAAQLAASRDVANKERLATFQSGLDEAAAARVTRDLPGLIDRIAGGGDDGRAIPAGGGGSPSDEAASSALFARAKDRAAQIARSSMTALRSAMAERGANVAGGNNPALAGAESRVISSAGRDLSDVNRDQTLAENDRVHAVADRNFNAAEQRRRDAMGLAPSLMSLMKATGGTLY